MVLWLVSLPCHSKHASKIRGGFRVFQLSFYLCLLHAVQGGSLKFLESSHTCLPNYLRHDFRPSSTTHPEAVQGNCVLQLQSRADNLTCREFLQQEAAFCFKLLLLRFLQGRPKPLSASSCFQNSQQVKISAHDCTYRLSRLNFGLGHSIFTTNTPCTPQNGVVFFSR